MNKTQFITNIKYIWEQITPEEMKTNEVFQVCMEIFCEQVNEFCGVSIDIQKSFKDEFYKEEFAKTYNQILMDTLTKLKTNQQYFNENSRFSSMNHGQNLLLPELLDNPSNFMSHQEIMLFNQYFNQKGMKESIEFAYEWISNHIQTGKSGEEIRIREVNPFELDVSGGIPISVYNYFVRVLQHPLGFQIQYSRVLTLDLDKNGKDTYNNLDNEYKLTPQRIDQDVSDPYYDDFYKNNNNPFLKSLVSQDFPEYLEFNGGYNASFTRLVITTREFSDGSITKYNLLKEISVVNDEIIVGLNDVIVDDFYMADSESNRTITFSINNLTMVYEEVYFHSRNYFRIYDSSNNLLIELGNDELVYLIPSNMVYTIDTGYTSVLDYMFTSEGVFGEEIIERDYVDADIPIDWALDSYQESNENISFDDTIKFIDYSTLDNTHKPLRFDFLSLDKNISEQTPYNNDVNDQAVLQNQSFRTSDNWDDSYFDWNLPKRTTKNYDKVYQKDDPERPWFFSQMNYEPWQLFDPQPHEPLSGYWVHPDKQWKFIGQDSGRPVIVGDGTIVHRGVRKYYEMSGFEKRVPLVTSPYYQGQQQNLEDDRDYWQQIEGLYIPKIGQTPYKTIGQTPNLFIGENYDSEGGVEQDQYSVFLKRKKQGRLNGEDPTKHNFINIINQGAETILSINTQVGVIGFDPQTPISIGSQGDTFTLYQSPNGDQNFGTDVYFYPENEAIIQNDKTSFQITDWEYGDIKWFETPYQRIQKTRCNDAHTFYRGISPRQEEYNYMYFDVKRDHESDPVNLQYITLEQFDIQEINY